MDLIIGIVLGIASPADFARNQNKSMKVENRLHKSTIAGRMNGRRKDMQQQLPLEAVLKNCNPLVLS